MDATVISLAERRAAAARAAAGPLPVPSSPSAPTRPQPGTTRPARPRPATGVPTPSGRDGSAARAWRRAIGHLLRTARLDAALRLVDVAEAAGVSPQYLSEVERGRKEPSSEVLAAVTGALGMTLVDLARDLAREVAAPSGDVRCLAA